MSSLFRSRLYNTPEPSFRGLFRLLEDFDQYAAPTFPQARGGSQMQMFTPKFDLHETETAYELHGELPGVERDNIKIEFTDPQTILVSGKSERSYTAGAPPVGAIEGETKPADTGTTETTERSTTEVGEARRAGEVAHMPASPYWVSERSVGQFTRSFQFPTLVDSDSVSASLNNGILAVSVPKAKKQETRRITIT